MSTLTQSVDQDEVPQVWPTVGEYGKVPISSIVPSPYNPRKHFADGDLDELAESIKQGGQREVATVRELTEDERIEYPGARYMLTSGERRWRAAVRANETHFEIRVKHYVSRSAEKLDAYMLNESRVGLSDLENAWAVQDLMLEHGWTTQTETARGINRDQVWVSQMFALLRCTPKVQERMHPRLKESDRLTKQVGVFFSRLHPDMQDSLIERMPIELKTAGSQLLWLKHELEEKGVELEKRNRKPANLRRVLEQFSENVSTKLKTLAADENLGRLFENTSDDDAEEIAVRLRNTFILFEKMVERVEELAQGEKSQTMIVPRAPVLPDPRPAPIARSIPATTVSASARAFAEHRARAPSPPQSRPAVAALGPRLAAASVSSVREKSGGSGAITVNYWDTNVCRIVTDKVSFRRYTELWDQGLLEFQRGGMPKPDHYPDRKDIAGL